MANLVAIQPLAPHLLAAPERLPTQQISLHDKVKQIGRKITKKLSRLFSTRQLKKSDISYIKNFNNRKIIAYPVTKHTVANVAPAFNDTFEGTRGFLKELVTLSIESVQAKYITPAINEFDHASSKIPQTLKNFSKILISLGEKSAIPIFEIIEKFDINDEALKKLHDVMNWALKDIDIKFKTNFKNSLKQQIDAKYPDLGASEADVNTCIDAAFHWIFNTDQSASPKANLEHIDSNLSTVIFQAALHKLAEEKIDYYTRKVNDTIEDKLPQIVEKNIKKFILEKTNKLSTRLASVLQNIKEEDMVLIYDKIIEILAKHSKNVEYSHKNADKAALEYAELEKHARAILARQPKTPKEQEDFDKCQQFIADLEALGGVEGIKKETLMKTFLASTGNIAPAIANDEFIGEISQHIINILMPDLVKDNKTIDGLEDLLTPLELPPEFKILLDEAKETVKMITTDDTYQEIMDTLDGDVKETAKDLLLLSCDVVLRMGLEEGIELVVKHMSKPEELNLIISTSLPSASNAILSSFIDNLIHANRVKLASSFRDLKELKRSLLQIAKKATTEFDLTIPKNADLFNELAEARLNGIIELLNAIPTKNKNPQKIAEIIEEYYKPTIDKNLADEFLKEHVENIATRIVAKRKVGKNAKVQSNEILESLHYIAKANATYDYLSPSIPTEFNNWVRPRLKELCVYVSDSSARTKEQVEKKIREFFEKKNIHADNNPYFADLIQSALPTEEFGSLLPAIFNIKSVRNLASAQMTRMVRNLRNFSITPLLNKTLPALSDQYLDPKTIDKLTTHKPSIESLEDEIQEIKNQIATVEEEIANPNDKTDSNHLEKKKTHLIEKLKKQQKLKRFVEKANQEHANALEKAKTELPTEVDKIARITYDLMRYNIRQSSSLGSYLFKKFVGKRSTKIKNVFYRLIKNFTENQAFNEHLLGSVFKTCVQTIDIVANGPKTDVSPLIDAANQGLLNTHIPVTKQAMNEKPYVIPFESERDESSLLKRIGQAIVKIFKSFITLFKAKYRLSKHQIFLINKAKNLCAANNPTVVLTPRRRQPSDHVNLPEGTIFIVNEPQAPEDHVNERGVIRPTTLELNGSLEKMRTIGLQIATKFSDNVIKLAKPALDTVKEYAFSLPEYVKQALDWLTRISEPAANSIFKNILKKGYKFGLSEIDQGFLASLFHELRDENGQIKENNPESLQKAFQQTNLTIQLKPDVLDVYCEPIRAWLNQSFDSKKDIKSLVDFLNPTIEYNDQTVSRFYVAAIQWLVSNKIHSNVNGLKNFLENDLENLVNTLLKEHFQKWFAVIFDEAASLLNPITNENLSRLMDEFGLDIDTQFTTNNAAKNAVLQANPNQKANLAYIANAVAHELSSGKPEYKFLPAGTSLFNIPAGLNKRDRKAYKMAEEYKIFNTLTDRIMRLFLPERKVLSDGSEVDSMTQLLDMIDPGSVVQDKIDEMLTFVKSVLPAKFANKTDGIIFKTKKLIKRFIVKALRNKIKQSLIQGLSSGFKHIVEANSRNTLLVNNFSSIHTQLIEAFSLLFLSPAQVTEYYNAMIAARDDPNLYAALLTKTKDYLRVKFRDSWEALELEQKFETDYFETFLQGINRKFLSTYMSDPNQSDSLKLDDAICASLASLSNDENRDAATETLTSTLFNKIAATNKWTNPESYRENFDLYFEEMLTPILYELKEVQKLECPGVKLSFEQIKTTLFNYFHGVNDPAAKNIYGNFINHLIKGLKFGGRLNGIVDYAVNMDFVQNTMTDALVPALHPIRASILNVTDLIGRSLQTTFLDDETYVEKLITPQSIAALKKKEKSLDKKHQEITDRKTRLKAKTHIPVAQQAAKTAKYNESLMKIDAEIRSVNDAIRAAEIEEQNAVEVRSKLNDNFSKGLGLMAKLISDVCRDKVPLWGTFAGTAEQFKKDVLERFNQEFFINEDMNLSLMAELANKTLTLLESKV